MWNPSAGNNLAQEEEIQKLWTRPLGRDPCSLCPSVCGIYVMKIIRCPPKATIPFCSANSVVAEMQPPSLGLTHCVC